MYIERQLFRYSNREERERVCVRESDCVKPGERERGSGVIWCK